MLYASGTSKSAKAFNCVQRAHQNTLENWAPVQITMIVNGLVNPRWAALFGAVWVVGRCIYGYGYAQGADNRKLGGAVSHLGDLPLLVMTFHTAASVLGWL
jgi:glutathione S-transferase